jgi:hypothetical protein
MRLWICDGGDFVGTEWECKMHILLQNPKEVSSIKCWGSMEIGGEAYKNWIENKVHPMSLISLYFVRK